MAKKTLAQIQKQIANLQREAQALRAKEAEEVIARIREAIEHYGLTTKDLFGAGAAGAAPRKARKTAKKRMAKRRTAGVIRYRDEAGNAWTGHGTRPRWFKAALESGKSLEDLAAK